MTSLADRITDYRIADSVQGALQILAHHAGTARVIAGGTDLTLSLSEGGGARGDDAPLTLVDVSLIDELRSIREHDGRLYIGAAVTHRELSESLLVREKATALAEAARSVGSPQIREVGTVGGNIVNAMPAADTAVALAALDARAVVVSVAAGEREVLLRDLYAGVGRSTVDPSQEVLKEVLFAVPTTSAFQRLARRRALALPILNAAVALDVSADRVCRRVRIALGPVDVAPWRARAAEAELEGRLMTAERIEAAARAVQEAVVCRDSIRACSLYRKPMARVLVQRALRACMGQRNA